MSSSPFYSPTPEEAAICRVLRAHREHHGLTAAVLAESIGVTPATYLRIEQGERPASLLQLQQICRVFSIELDDLADGAKRLTSERLPEVLPSKSAACRSPTLCVQRPK